jgi:hypothetical protein
MSLKLIIEETNRGFIIQSFLTNKYKRVILVNDHDIAYVIFDSDEEARNYVNEDGCVTCKWVSHFDTKDAALAFLAHEYDNLQVIQYKSI